MFPLLSARRSASRGARGSGRSHSRLPNLRPPRSPWKAPGGPVAAGIGDRDGDFSRLSALAALAPAWAASDALAASPPFVRGYDRVPTMSALATVGRSVGASLLVAGGGFVMLLTPFVDSSAWMAVAVVFALGGWWLQPGGPGWVACLGRLHVSRWSGYSSSFDFSHRNRPNSMPLLPQDGLRLRTTCRCRTQVRVGGIVAATVNLALGVGYGLVAVTGNLARPLVRRAHAHPRAHGDAGCRVGRCRHGRSCVGVPSDGR